jgi:hypothetical protein
MYEALYNEDNKRFYYAIYSYKQGPRCRFKKSTLKSQEYFSTAIEAEDKALEEIKSWNEEFIDEMRKILINKFMRHENLPEHRQD